MNNTDNVTNFAEHQYQIARDDILSHITPFLDKELPDLVVRVHNTGNPGEITFKIKFGYNKDDDVERIIESQVKPPKVVDVRPGEILNGQLRLF